MYVIELHDAVWSENQFRRHNHQRNLRRPCLYVGQTARSPQARFEQHRKGEKSNRYVRRHGYRLRQDLAADALGDREPCFQSRDAALQAEKSAAAALKSRGFAVWSA